MIPLYQTYGGQFMKRLRRNGWKFALDLMMMALLALMYSKHTFGLAFHEIGGPALRQVRLQHPRELDPPGLDPHTDVR